MTQPTPFTQEQLAWLLPRLHNGSSAVPQLAASLAVPSLAVPSLGGQSWGGPSASVAARATLPAFTAGHPVPGQTSGGIFLPPSLGSTIPPISFLSPNLGARFVPQVPQPAPIPSAGTVDAGSADAGTFPPISLHAPNVSAGTVPPPGTDGSTSRADGTANPPNPAVSGRLNVGNYIG